MLFILGRTRGDKIDEHEDGITPDPAEFEVGSRELRRAFLRSISYLCDYQNGGDTTTAFASQGTPQGIIYWIASNDCKTSGKDIVQFTTYILDSVKHVEPHEVLEIETGVFTRAVRFSSQRISVYAKLLSDRLNFVLRDLTEHEPSNGKLVISYIAGLSYCPILT